MSGCKLVAHKHLAQGPQVHNASMWTSYLAGPQGLYPAQQYFAADFLQVQQLEVLPVSELTFSQKEMLSLLGRWLGDPVPAVLQVLDLSSSPLRSVHAIDARALRQAVLEDRIDRVVTELQRIAHLHSEKLVRIRHSIVHGPAQKRMLQHEHHQREPLDQNSQPVLEGNVRNQATSGPEGGKQSLTDDTAEGRQAKGLAKLASIDAWHERFLAEDGSLALGDELARQVMSQMAPHLLRPAALQAIWASCVNAPSTASESTSGEHFEETVAAHVAHVLPSDYRVYRNVTFSQRGAASERSKGELDCVVVSPARDVIAIIEVKLNANDVFRDSPKLAAAIPILRGTLEAVAVASRGGATKLHGQRVLPDGSSRSCEQTELELHWRNVHDQVQCIYVTAGAELPDFKHMVVSHLKSMVGWEVQQNTELGQKLTLAMRQATLRLDRFADHLLGPLNEYIRSIVPFLQECAFYHGILPPGPG